MKKLLSIFILLFFVSFPAHAGLRAVAGSSGGGGGSTTPGGSSGQVQYNNAGAFGGTSLLTIGTTTNSIIVQTQIGVGTSLPNAGVAVDANNTTGAIALPIGTTGQEPASPLNGMIRYNITTSSFEGYSGSSWGSLGGGITASSVATFTNKTLNTSATGNVLQINGNTITAITGNTGTVATSSGTLTAGDCVSIDANKNFVDAGGVCTTGGGGGTVSAGIAGQIAYYSVNGTTVLGTSTVPTSVTLPLGTSLSQTNPRISGDATTGLYSSGTGKVDIAASGIRALDIGSTIISTNLPLSIGTTVNGYPLDVAIGTATGVHFGYITSAGQSAAFILDASQAAGGDNFYFDSGTSANFEPHNFYVYDATANKTDLNIYGPTGSISTFSTGTFGFNSSSAFASSTNDTAISRISANKLAIGNGSQGDYSGVLAVGNVAIGTATPLSGAILTLAGHLGFYQSSTPTVSSCGSGSIVAGSADNKGQITGVTAATACTITFISALPAVPVCQLIGSATIVNPVITSISTSAVTFGMTSYTGTLYYDCF